jgi:hypothetical protein
MAFSRLQAEVISSTPRLLGEGSLVIGNSRNVKAEFFMLLEKNTRHFDLTSTAFTFPFK